MIFLFISFFIPRKTSAKMGLQNKLKKQVTTFLEGNPLFLFQFNKNN